METKTKTLTRDELQALIITLGIARDQYLLTHNPLDARCFDQVRIVLRHMDAMADPSFGGPSEATLEIVNIVP